MGGKHGTAGQGRLIGTWPTTDEGGRADQLLHAGTGEGDAEQVAAIVIDGPAAGLGQCSLCRAVCGLLDDDAGEFVA
jgi:hypothetical protein